MDVFKVEIVVFLQRMMNICLLIILLNNLQSCITPLEENSDDEKNYKQLLVIFLHIVRK